MSALAFPLRYLRLQTRLGSRLWVRDTPSALSLALLLSVPYWLVEGSNYFHKDGFIDKIGTFASVLTGFYVAGLVAVATFPRSEYGLDKVIELGAIKAPAIGGGEDEYLTRREYVCAMFGYLAFASLIITILAIVCVTTADWLKLVNGVSLSIGERGLSVTRAWIRGVVIFGSNAALSHVFVTTVRGLYYLIDRIYAVSPTPLDRDEM